MAIDLATEKLMTLADVARRLRKSITTIKRWIERGHLEGVLLPGGWHSSMEAIQRMADRLTAERRPALAKPSPERNGTYP